MSQPDFCKRFTAQYWHSSNYHLVYLDPLLCEVTPKKPREWSVPILGRIWPLTDPPDSPKQLLVKIAAASNIYSDKATVVSCLRRGRIGMTNESERAVARSVAKALEANKLTDRHFASAGELTAEIPSKIVNAPDAQSLVIVDGMLARRAAVPEDVRKTVDVLFPELDRMQQRQIECVLSDTPASLLRGYDPIVGVGVDSAAFYARATLDLMRVPWYPCARIVGLYVTNADGHAYVDALAILVQPHPTLNKIILRSLPPTRWGLLEELKSRKDEISQETTRLKALTSAVSTSYEKDMEFLFPLHFFLISCRLNGADTTCLSNRSPGATRVLKDYLHALEELQVELRRLNIASQILHQETRLNDLLPELYRGP